LSGFLITYLILTEIKTAGRLDVKSFYLRRALRIWPLYYLVIVFGFVVYPLIGSVYGFSRYLGPANPLYYIFFLSNFDVLHHGIGNVAASRSITWSVAIEEQFYFVWPLLFYFIPRSFYKLIFPAIIIASALFRLAHVDNGLTLYYHTFSVISDMAVGGFVAYLVITSAAVKEFFANLRSPVIALVYLAGVLMILFSSFLFIGPVLLTLNRIANALFFAFVILEQNYAQGSLIKMSAVKPISALGKYTYGLYLLHPIAIMCCVQLMQRLRFDLNNLFIGWLQGLLALLLSILACYASYHLYEKYFLTLKARFAHVKSQPSSSRSD